MKTYRLHCFLSENDYRLLTQAARTGRFSYNYTRNADSGDIVFSTPNVKRLCANLESIIDFGATSASKVLKEVGTGVEAYMFFRV